MAKDNKKTKVIKIRMTLKEYSDLKNKAQKNHWKMSNYVRSALRQYDDEMGRKRYSVVKEYIRYWERYENEIRHIGGNLNQAMKRINELAKIGRLTKDEACDMMILIREQREKIFNHIDELDDLSHKILR